MNKSKVLSRLAVSGLCMLLAPVAVAEPGPGRQLYEDHCTACHACTVRQRTQHKAHTLEAIEIQVRRWSGELGLTWSEAQLLAVRRYLNLRYYRYTEP